MPTMIDFGSFTFTGDGTITRQEFKYNKTFPSTPKIFLTLQRNSSTNLLEADVMLISADNESFYVAYRSTNGLYHVVNWLAVY